MNGLRLRRQAVVGLIAGAAAVMAALPAHAAPGAHRHAGTRPAAAVSGSTAAARPSYPVRRHGHPDVAKRTAVTPAAHSKRDGGQSELAAPSAHVVRAVTSATRWTASSAVLARVASATSPRAPPARQ